MELDLAFEEVGGARADYEFRWGGEVAGESDVVVVHMGEDYIVDVTWSEAAFGERGNGIGICSVGAAGGEVLL